MATAEELNQMCDGRIDKAKVHDKVVAICPKEKTVTLRLTVGESFNKPVLYLSTEANDPLVASLETATYTPGLEGAVVRSGGFFPRRIGRAASWW